MSAWLYRQKKSKYWWLGWRVGGKCHFRSTKQTEREEAAKELAKIQTLFAAHRAGTLDAVYQALSGKVLPRLSLKAALNEWLTEVKSANGQGTFKRYEDIANDFAGFMGATDIKPLLSEVGTEHVRDYLTHRRGKRSVSTANLERKILSIFFLRSIRNQYIRENPVLPVRLFKVKDEEIVKRRAFTLEELRLAYRKAPNAFWRYMILGGFYSGLRLGDLITLAWPSVDFVENMLRVKPRKTGEKTVSVPMAAPFRAELLERFAAAGKPKNGYVWPKQAGAYGESGSGQFSNQFYDDILSPCGLVPVRERSNGTTGKGKTSGRKINPISFHSLRHSFISLLKATGGSQIVAKELAGHSSDLISDAYTTLPKEVLAQAIDALPTLDS